MFKRLNFLWLLLLMVSPIAFADTGNSIDLVKDGAKVFISPAWSGGRYYYGGTTKFTYRSDMYVAVNPTTEEVPSVFNTKLPNEVWTLIATGETTDEGATYYIYNEHTGYYLGNSYYKYGTSFYYLNITKELGSAGKFLFAAGEIQYPTSSSDPYLDTSSLVTIKEVSTITDKPYLSNWGDFTTTKDYHKLQVEASIRDDYLLTYFDLTDATDAEFDTSDSFLPDDLTAEKVSDGLKVNVVPNAKYTSGYTEGYFLNVDNSDSENIKAYGNDYARYLGDAAIWTLKQVDPATPYVFYIYNELTDSYVPSIGDSAASTELVLVSLTDEEKAAGQTVPSNAGKFKATWMVNNRNIDSQTYNPTRQLVSEWIFEDTEATSSAKYLYCDNSGSSSNAVLKNAASGNANEYFLVTNPLEYDDELSGIEKNALKMIYLANYTPTKTSTESWSHNSSLNRTNISISQESTGKGYISRFSYNTVNGLMAYNMENIALSDTIQGWRSVWQFRPYYEHNERQDNKYYIYNTITKEYFGKTSDTANSNIELVTDNADAGIYSFVSTGLSGGYYYIMDVSSDDIACPYLAVASRGNAARLQCVASPTTNGMFGLEEPNNVSIRYIYPGSDVWISGVEKMGNNGFLNIKTDAMNAVLNNWEAGWNSVWNLLPDDKYDIRQQDDDPTEGDHAIVVANTETYGANLHHSYRFNETNNNWNLCMDRITEDFGEDTQLANGDVIPGETDLHTLTYNFYNRYKKIFLGPITSTAPGQTVALIENTSKVSISHITPLETQENAGNYRFELSDDGMKVYIYDVDARKAGNTNCYLGIDEASNVLVNTSKDSSNCGFYVREAYGTSYSFAEDEAYVRLTTYRSLETVVAATNNGTILKGARTKDSDGNWVELELGEYALWQLLKEDDKADTYYIYNFAGDKYIKSTVGLGSGISLSLCSDKESAGTFRISMDPQITSAVILKDTKDTGSSMYVNCNPTTTGSGSADVVMYECKQANRLFFIGEAREQDWSTTPKVTLQDGQLIQIIPWLYKQEDDEWNPYINADGGYIYQTDDDTTVQRDNGADIETKNVDEIYYTWQLVAAKDSEGNAVENVYYLVNLGTGQYMGQAVYGQSTQLIESTDGSVPSDARPYEFIFNSTGNYYILRQHNSDETISTTNSYLYSVLDQDQSVGVQGFSTYNYNSFKANTNSDGSIDHTYQQAWYYINPVDKTPAFDKDWLDWVYDNYFPDPELGEPGEVVGYFDADKPVEYLPDDEKYMVTDPETGEKRKWTFEELYEVVKKNYDDYNANGTSDLEIYKTFIETFSALRKAVEDEEYLIHPKPGHFYQIENAYPQYGDGVVLSETYYEQDWHVRSGKQKVDFMVNDDDNTIADRSHIRSYWRFDNKDLVVDDADKEAAKSAYADPDAQCYFYIRAVNSRDVMSNSSVNTVVDTRPDTDEEAGLFSIKKDYELNVYPGSLLLVSHKNNATRSTVDGHSLLGAYYPDGSFIPTIRDGSTTRIEPTDQIVTNGNPQNWYIREVTRIPIVFEDVDGYTGYKYRTFCYPFRVELPDFEEEGLWCYTQGHAVVDGEEQEGVLRLVSHDSGVVPAYQPFILESRKGKDISYLKILYDADLSSTESNSGKSQVRRRESSSDTETDETLPWSMTSWNYEDINDTDEAELSNNEISHNRFDEFDEAGSTTSTATGTGLVGVISLHALEPGTTVYLLNGDNVATSVTGGTDVSYDPDILTDETGNPKLAMPNTDSDVYTYILPINSAVIKSVGDVAPSITIDEETVVAGTEDIQQDVLQEREPERDANGNLIYYDLYGRRVTNPSTGIYILTNGKKVVVRN